MQLSYYAAVVLACIYFGFSFAAQFQLSVVTPENKIIKVPCERPTTFRSGTTIAHIKHFLAPIVGIPVAQQVLVKRVVRLLDFEIYGTITYTLQDDKTCQYYGITLKKNSL